MTAFEYVTLTWLLVLTLVGGIVWILHSRGLRFMRGYAEMIDRTCDRW